MLFLAIVNLALTPVAAKSSLSSFSDNSFTVATLLAIFFYEVNVARQRLQNCGRQKSFKENLWDFNWHLNSRVRNEGREREREWNPKQNSRKGKKE